MRRIIILYTIRIEEKSSDVNMKFVKRKKDNSISYQISLRPEYLLMSGIKEDDKLIAIAKKGQIIIKKIDKEEE